MGVLSRPQTTSPELPLARADGVGRWIIRHHRPVYLYADLLDLGGDAALDVLSDEQKPIEKVDILVAGTECDNYSGLNFFTQAPPGGVATEGVGKSGSTMEAMILYIKKRLPKIIIWENSDRTKAKDLQHLLSTLWKLGYTCHLEKIDASSYSPQSRCRFYMIGWHSPAVASIAAKEDMTEERCADILSQSWIPLAFDLIRQLEGHSMTLDSFLLDDDHEEVREWRAHRLATKTEKGSKEKGSGSGRQGEFESEHLELFSKARCADTSDPLPWPVTEEHLKERGLLEVTLHLPRRFQESTFYHYVTHDMSKPLPAKVGQWHNIILSLALCLQFILGAVISIFLFRSSFDP